MKHIEVTEEFVVRSEDGDFIMEKGDQIRVKESGYVRSELATLDPDSALYQFVIHDFEGNKTKYMSLDSDSLQDLNDWFYNK